MFIYSNASRTYTRMRDSLNISIICCLFLKPTAFGYTLHMMVQEIKQELVLILILPKRRHKTAMISTLI